MIRRGLLLLVAVGVANGQTFQDTELRLDTNFGTPIIGRIEDWSGLPVLKAQVASYYAERIRARAAAALAYIVEVTPQLAEAQRDVDALHSVAQTYPFLVAPLPVQFDASVASVEVVPAPLTTVPINLPGPPVAPVVVVPVAPPSFGQAVPILTADGSTVLVNIPPQVDPVTGSVVNVPTSQLLPGPPGPPGIPVPLESAQPAPAVEEVCSMDCVPGGTCPAECGCNVRCTAGMNCPSYCALCIVGCTAGLDCPPTCVS